MSRTQKILTTALWGLMVLIMVGVLAAGWWKNDRSAAHTANVSPASGAGTGEVLFSVPSFALVDQNEKPVSDQSVRGKPWIAAFIFTNCAGPCPMMSSNMAKLQKRVPDANLRLVSFTVDPKRDTSAVLKKYAEQFGADESRWSFVTGTEQQMQDVARGMLMAAQPATETTDIIHSTKFLLVDKSCGVRGIYDSNPEGMDQLAADAAKLAAEAR
jgi:protein SCO1